MNNLRRHSGFALFLLVIPVTVVGSSVAVEQLSSLNEIRVTVTAPVYEPIPRVNRKQLEQDLKEEVSRCLQCGGVFVSDDATVELLVDIKYVESCDEVVFLVSGHVREFAHLLRKWAPSDEAVRVVSWSDQFLVRASPDEINHVLTEAVVLLAASLVDRIEEAQSDWSRGIKTGVRSDDSDDLVTEP